MKTLENYDFEEVATLCLSKNKTEEAIVAYEKGGNFMEAAKVLIELDHFQRAFEFANKCDHLDVWRFVGRAQLRRYQSSMEQETRSIEVEDNPEENSFSSFEEEEEDSIDTKNPEAHPMEDFFVKEGKPQAKNNQRDEVPKQTIKNPWDGLADPKFTPPLKKKDTESDLQNILRSTIF